MTDFFPGFEHRRVATSGADINLVTGGKGPPLLLLHGYPQTHLLWRKIAPRLAEEFTLVIPDLRGYGDSSKPAAGPDQVAYSKRALAQDQAETMSALGFDRFMVAAMTAAPASRTAWCGTMPSGSSASPCSTSCRPCTASRRSTTRRRAAASIGFPDPARRTAGAADRRRSRILSAPHAGSRALPGPARARGVRRISSLLCQPRDDPRDLRRVPRRAGIDIEHDRVDRARKITMPLLVLWGRSSGQGSGYDMLAVWRDHAKDVRGQAIDSGHFLPEDAPDPTYAALRDFFKGNA